MPSFEEELISNFFNHNTKYNSDVDLSWCMSTDASGDLNYQYFLKLKLHLFFLRNLG